MVTDEFSKLDSFENLYKAHLKARRSKQYSKEVIDFESDLGPTLARLAESIKHGSYALQGYYFFEVFEPKKRLIHALHYQDRVVQHCLCDEIVGPSLESKLIFDNAACRIGKGSSFVYKWITLFLSDYYKKHGCQGYFLRCDIRKFFDSIDHQILKEKLSEVFHDVNTYQFLMDIIDSYEVTSGKGIPMGNQTSQWFAIYYLDELDRFIKEKLRIKYYVRYMDDMLIIAQDKNGLKVILSLLRVFLRINLKMSFNDKTQIYPLRNGTDFLGFHFYLTETGKVIRKVMLKSKKNMRRAMKNFARKYSQGLVDFETIRQSISSYCAHMRQGHTFFLRKKILNQFPLRKSKC